MNTPMQAHALRLSPGEDLRDALTRALHELNMQAAFVIQGIGSLSVAQLRFAGEDNATAIRADLEILTLAGSLSVNGVHLHMAVADSIGRVTGGHVAPGCIVRTTAEIVLALLPEHRFSREHDEATGFPELSITPRRQAGQETPPK
jgi:uncharacterized protein